MSEKTLQRAICDYLRYQYPGVMFNSDLSGAMKLTIGQAVALKNLRNTRGYPDLMIFEPRNGYHGLFLELKKEGEKIFSKNGKPLSLHIAEQKRCIQELKKRNYQAHFAIGFDHAKRIIDEYLAKK